MIKELLYPFTEQFSYLNIFQYITFRAAYGAITAFAICVLLIPLLIKLQRRSKLGENIRDDGPSTHLEKKGTPTMGGVIIVFAIVLSIILWMDITSIYTWIIVFVVLGAALIGFIDDFLKLIQEKKTGLRSWAKLTGQIIIGLVTGVILLLIGDEEITRIYIPFIKDVYLDLGVWYIFFVMLVIISSSNAVNLTDGLDGLATGLVILVGIGYTVIAYVTGRVDFAEYLGIPFIQDAGELTILGLIVVGACGGFLWYNTKPASIMMGDTGSLTLGALLSILAIITKHELLLFIMGGVFVIETLSVMIQVASFKLFKKRVFKMSPIHHHFELKGWQESKIVVRFWIGGAFFLIIALSTLKIR